MTTASRIALALVLLASSRVSAQPTAASLFSSRVEVVAPSSELVRVRLPTEILDATGPGFDLLRLDANGDALSFVVESAPIDASRDVATSIVVPSEATQETLATTPPSYVERFDLELPADPPPGSPWMLDLGTGTSRFTATLVISGLEPGAPPAIERTTFRLADGVERTRFELPSSWPRRFRVEIRGQDGYLSPSFSFVSRLASSAVSVERELPLRVVETTRLADGIELVVELPSTTHPSALRFDAGSRALACDVSIVSTVLGKEVAIGEGSIDLSGATAPREFAIGRTSSNRIRIRLVGRTATPDLSVRVVGILRDPTLVFDGSELYYRGGRASIYFGGGRVRPLPSTESTPLFDRIHDRIAITEPEAVMANPNRVAPPALAFAMRPGAAIDRRAFRSFAPLTVPASPEGLVRVFVPPRILVEANDDASDLRIVDAAGRQWPYVTDQRDVTPVPFPVRATRIANPRGRSVHRIALPERGVTIVGVRVATSEALVDRPVVLESERPDGTREPLVTSRLVHRPDANAPLDLVVPRGRFRTLVVTVEDGDEAPLELGFSLLLVRKELLLAAPPGAYRLYVGALAATPESRTARYDLERAGMLVFEIDTARATPGALVANPESEPPTAFSRERWRDVVLWTVLVFVTLVLFGFTFRLVRAQAAPADASLPPTDE